MGSDLIAIFEFTMQDGEVKKSTIEFYSKDEEVIRINIGGHNGESFWINLEALDTISSTDSSQDTL